MKPLDFAAALTVILIWAMNFIVGKVAIGQIPPNLLLAIRFALVAVLLSPFLRPPGKSWVLILAMSVVLGGLHFGLLFSGLRGVDAGLAAIAIQLSVPFSLILATIVYRERAGVMQYAGIAVAFVGVYMLGGDPASAPSVPHLLMVVTSAFAWALANIIIKRIGPINIFVLNAWFTVFALPQFLLASLLFEHGQMQALADADWRGWGGIVFMALGASITAYGLWYYLIRKYEVNRVVPLMLLAPVLAVLFAALILDEPLTARILLGGAVTLSGVAMIHFLRPPSPPPSPPTPPTPPPAPPPAPVI
jgi:O-acetylserine/cysteine efflux transporter